MFKRLLYSSADPSRIGASVKSFLVGFIPVIVLLTGWDIEGASAVINAIVDIVALTLSIVSSATFLLGMLRKVQLGRWTARD
ncbi:MAG: hypothetical protein ABJP08_28970 [Roseibium sp.]